MSSNEESMDEESVTSNEVPQDLLFGQMLNSVLSRHFEYRQDDKTLNIAEILLLMKQSIDTQSELLLEVIKEIKKST